jgi:hypothetical protein
MPAMGHRPDRTDQQLDELAERFSANSLKVRVAREGAALDLSSTS